MSFNQLLDQFLGSNNNQAVNSDTKAQAPRSTLNDLTKNIPGGLASGAAAGGIVALLMSKKSHRKFAGKAATYGGAALLGGIALKAYQNWQQQTPPTSYQTNALQNSSGNGEDFHHQAVAGASSELPFELVLIRAMIAACRADGHIDANEQQRIFSAVNRMDLSSEHKGVIFDSLQQDISIAQLTEYVNNDEQKMELYLASCLVVNSDQSAERAHLNALAGALQLPAELCRELEIQARDANVVAA